MSESPVADPIYYQASLWGTRESFIYSFKSALASATVTIQFLKIDDERARLRAEASVRLPLSKPIQYLIESEFKSFAAQSQTARFAFYRETDQRKQSEKSVTVDEEGLCFSASNGKTHFAAFKDLNIERHTLINPALTFVGLRTFMSQNLEATGAIVTTSSGRLYSLRLHELKADEFEMFASPFAPSGGVSSSGVENKLNFVWDADAGAPKRLGLKVPIIGTVELRLESAEKSS